MREDAFFLIHRIPSVSSQGAWTKREPREGANLSLKVSKFGFFFLFSTLSTHSSPSNSFQKYQTDRSSESYVLRFYPLINFIFFNFFLSFILFLFIIFFFCIFFFFRIGKVERETEEQRKKENSFIFRIFVCFTTGNEIQCQKIIRKF